MSAIEHDFLFSSLDSKRPTTARKVHVRRLYDVFQLCLHRNDLVRARRAWSILVRCKEINWKTLWKTGIHVLGENSVDDADSSEERIRFLKTIMRQYPEDEREEILKELVLRLIHSGMYRQALDELELYLPSLPYQDNPVLHVYAGFISLYLAQLHVEHPPSLGNVDTPLWDRIMIRDAQTHFERAKFLDTENVVATTFLEQLPIITRPPQDRGTPESDEDEEIDTSRRDQEQCRKRLKS